MKYALITLGLGYIAVWQFGNFKEYIILFALLFWIGFGIYLTSKRVDVLSSLSDKLKAILVTIIGSMVLGFILVYSISVDWISIWYLPIFLSILVLTRPILKFFINLTIREPGSFGVMSETDKGETVRSKSEKKVADWLYANNYEYEYEREITLPTGAKILSDFYLSKYDIYIEYWGMASANNEVGEKYRERKSEKKELYAEYNYKLMDIYPHHLYELDKYIPDEINRLTGQKSSFLTWFKRIFGQLSSSSEEVSPEKTSPHSSSMDQQLFCTNCGNQVKNFGDFCVKCGTEMK